jgi:hypothetical protein
MFHATYREVMAYHGRAGFWLVQWHGMDADRCEENVYLSHGRNQAPRPTDKIAVLEAKVKLHHPDWDVDTPGPTSGCSLNATSNVQGRLLNGETSVCTSPASHYTGRFVHIEQDPGFRSSSDWLQPVMDTWPLPVRRGPSR